jgi:hypothetical protein
MSFAITALLECETPATTATLAGSGSEEVALTRKEKEDQHLMQAFNIAFDALNSNGSAASSSLSTTTGQLMSEGNDLSNLVNGGNASGNTGLGAGIRLALSLQRTIISTAVSLVDRNAITRLNHFRYAYLHCTSHGSHSSGGTSSTTTNVPTSRGEEKEEASHVFSKPLALTKLAHFLMDMHRENGKWVGAKSRPLVLMAEKPQTKTYMVVGYEYPEKAGTVVRNRFGQNFELAAQTMKGTFQFDTFESNVVEVDGNDVQRFIEQLHYMMDSM